MQRTIAPPEGSPVDTARQLVWSPDGTEMSLTLRTQALVLFDLVAGTSEGSPGGFFGSWSGDGSRFAVSGIATPIQVRAGARGQVQATVAGLRAFGTTRFLDNERLARVTVNGYLDIIDIASGSRVGDTVPLPYPRPQAVVSGLTPGPDGSCILIGSIDANIRRIELDRDRWLERACQIAGRNLTQAEWERHLGTVGPYDTTCPDYPPGE